MEKSAMQTFISNVKNVLGPNKTGSDKGGVVDTIIMVAGFALLAVGVLSFIVPAILNSGADTADCIESASSMTAEQTEKKCKSGEHTKKNSFKKGDSYKSRYGG